MSDDHMALQEQIIQLRAKVTALTQLVEALWGIQLSQVDDPVAVGKAIIDDHFRKNEAIRERHGDQAFVLQVSDALTSILDRAVAREEHRRQRGRRS